MDGNGRHMVCNNYKGIYLFNTNTRERAPVSFRFEFFRQRFWTRRSIENFIEILYLLEITDSTKQNEIRKVSFFRIDTNLE